MAPSFSQTTILLFTLIVFSSFKSSESCGIASYWGQNINEGTLRRACENGYIRYSSLYEYINIASLINFGSGQDPVLNLHNHCDAALGTCRGLSEEIRACQLLGVKVLLSLGPSGAILSSPQDAKNVANYLWTNFLAPDSDGPLGDAPLDGIDFAIWGALSPLYWDDLTRELARYRSQKNISLAALPQCPYPDYYLNAAIQTGLFNYVWVQFYNNPPCDYSGGEATLINAWNVWNSSLPEGTQLSFGLPASPEAASSGHIVAHVLRDDILPLIRNSKDYGGVMLWDSYFDGQSHYSYQIFYGVCPASLKLPSDGLYSN